MLFRLFVEVLLIGWTGDRHSWLGTPTRKMRGQEQRSSLLRSSPCGRAQIVHYLFQRIAAFAAMTRWVDDHFEVAYPDDRDPGALISNFADRFLNVKGRSANRFNQGLRLQAPTKKRSNQPR